MLQPVSRLSRVRCSRGVRPTAPGKPSRGCHRRSPHAAERRRLSISSSKPAPAATAALPACRPPQTPRAGPPPWRTRGVRAPRPPAVPGRPLSSLGWSGEISPPRLRVRRVSGSASRGGSKRSHISRWRTNAVGALPACRVAPARSSGGRVLAPSAARPRRSRVARAH